MNELEILQEGEMESAYHFGENPPKPSWLDVESFNRGRTFFQEYFFSYFLAMFTSLVGGLSVINLLEPLVFTGASDEPKKSVHRYFLTFRHVTLWHYGNVWDKSSKAYASIQTVRSIHCKVSNDMNNARHNNKSVFFSQYDMALVQCGFMGTSVLYPEYFGIPNDRKRLEDYVHFWKGIGHLLGISDKYNICTNGYDNANVKCKAIEKDVLLKALKNPPKDFQTMVEAFIGGLNLIFKFKLLSSEAVLAFGMDALKHSRDRLSFMDGFRLCFLKGVVILLKHSAIFRKLLNKTFEKVMGCSNMY